MSLFGLYFKERSNYTPKTLDITKNGLVSQIKCFSADICLFLLGNVCDNHYRFSIFFDYIFEYTLEKGICDKHSSNISESLKSSAMGTHFSCFFAIHFKSCAIQNQIVSRVLLNFCYNQSNYGDGIPSFFSSSRSSIFFAELIYRILNKKGS